jgi:hypothetical protein
VNEIDLTQLDAVRLGTIPIVRIMGGRHELWPAVVPPPPVPPPVTVVGPGNSGGNTVTLPPHAPGDILLIVATSRATPSTPGTPATSGMTGWGYHTEERPPGSGNWVTEYRIIAIPGSPGTPGTPGVPANVPAAPAAVGTVPAWQTIGTGASGGDNGAGIRVAWARATAANHTSGTWSMTPQAGATGAIVLRDGGTLTPLVTSAVVADQPYPAITPLRADGSSMGIRVAAVRGTVGGTFNLAAGWTRAVNNADLAIDVSPGLNASIPALATGRSPSIAMTFEIGAT